MGTMSRPPAAVHRWRCRNHRVRPIDGDDMAWVECRHRPVPAAELGEQLGEDRDHGTDCRNCFPRGPREPRRPAW